jgi:hypothetical protein
MNNDLDKVELYAFRRDYIGKNYDPTNPHMYADLAEQLDMNRDAVRKVCRRMGLSSINANAQYEEHAAVLDVGALKRFINVPRRLEEVADRFNVAPYKIRKALDALKSEHYVFDVVDDKIALAKEIAPMANKLEIDFNKYAEVEVPFGVIADNHIGSKYERLDVLNDIFDRFEEAGVRTVYQCGNLIEGESVHNKFDVYVHGVTDQVQNFIDKFPQRKGITTQFVTGDDHEGWYVQSEHIDFVRLFVNEC